MKIIFLLILLLLCNCSTQAADIKSGDIVFQITETDRSKAIQLASHSKYTHMGIVVFIKKEPLVFHASSITIFEPFKEWIDSGIDKHFVIKRLKSYPNGFNKENEVKLNEVIQRFVGLPYDDYYEISDERMYCSELIWKIYKNFLNIEIGKLRKLSEYDIEHHEVKEKLKQYIGERLSYEELMISPGDIFNSNLVFKINGK